MKTQKVTLNINSPDLEKIAQAGNMIHRGGLVIFPTETVYGIAANASDPRAVQALRGVKRRSDDKPFSILISSKEDVDLFGQNLPTAIYKVIDTFWPGPLTVIIPSKDGKNVGLRMPGHRIALELVRQAQCPVAAPSANIEGEEPAKTCDEALLKFDGQVEMAIDAGPTYLRLSSTVVDLTKENPVVLRKGPIDQKKIEQALSNKQILFVCTGNSCRSVMGEYFMREFLAMAKRKDVEVASAGTSAFLSSGPTPSTLKVLAEEGIDAAAHRSRSLTKIMLKKADLILAMTSTHRCQIINFEPSVANRTYLLREFAKTSQGEYDLGVPDPIGQDGGTYESCAKVIKESVKKVMELI